MKFKYKASGRTAEEITFRCSGEVHAVDAIEASTKAADTIRRTMHCDADTITVKASAEKPSKAAQQPPPPESELRLMTISGLANLCARDWRNVWFGAAPYIEAMREMRSIDSPVLQESGREVVRYFLSNAKLWRGPVAVAVKAELRRRLTS